MDLTILIEGKPAVLKKGSSIDLVCENPFFSESDDFSFNISFPLKDCWQNQQIFGAINRHGHNASDKPFNMEIRSGSVCRIGYGVINSVTDVEVKVQFLGNVSAQNYKCDLDELKIIDYAGGVKFFAPEKTPISQAWAAKDPLGDNPWICIPWVNENTGNLQNNVVLPDPDNYVVGSSPDSCMKWANADDKYDVPEDIPYLSGMKYLIAIAIDIANGIGFSYNFDDWANSKYKWLLCCNTVPGAWFGAFSGSVLPDWSVLEFFRNLEPLLEGFFDIDLVNSSISFHSYSFLAASDVVIDNVFDEFSSEVTDKEDACQFIPHRYLGYDFGDSSTEALYSCPWVVNYFSNIRNGVKEFDTLSEYCQFALDAKWWKYGSPNHRHPDGVHPATALHYIKDIDRYLFLDYVWMEKESIFNKPQYFPGLNGSVVEIKKDRKMCAPAYINQFGPINIPVDKLKDKDSPEKLIKFVPAKIETTIYNNKVVFLSPDCDAEDDDTHRLSGLSIDEREELSSELQKRKLREYAEEGFKKRSAAFSKIFVAFYPDLAFCRPYVPWSVTPLIDNSAVTDMFKPRYMPSKYTLSLSRADGKFDGFPVLDVNRKFEFSFLSDTIPDVMSVFIIRGKRYLCESLNVSFNESGMSQKIKGTFWKIVG